MFESTTILVGLVVAVGLVAVRSGVKIVPQGQNWTVERFGRYTTTLQSGLHFVVPVIDRIGKKLSVMESVLDIPPQNVISKDNVSIVADCVTFYQITEPQKAAYQIDNLELGIQNLTITNLRSVLGGMELDHMLSSRQEINSKLLAEVDMATQPWGVKITRVEIRDLMMSSELQEAMNLQMTAERKRRAIVTEAEGKKSSEILLAEGERSSKILLAEGEKEAKILQAQGEREAAILEAEARERHAEAEAKSTEVVSKAIKEGDVAAIQYFLGMEYIKALEGIGASSNSKLVLMPLEASGVTGSIAGIAQVLQQNLGNK